jgi:hypothetical protein
MSSPSSHIGLAQLESGAAKIRAHERAKPNAPRKPASRVLGAIAAEDHGGCRGLASQAQPNRFGRYGFVVDEIVSV